MKIGPQIKWWDSTLISMSILPDMYIMLNKYTIFKVHFHVNIWITDISFPVSFHTLTTDNVCDQVGVSLWKVLGVIACLYQMMPRCCFCSTPTKAVGSWLPPCNEAFVRPLLAAAGAEWRACDWLSCHCRSIHARVMCSAGDTLLHPWEVTRGKERIHARNIAATGILL